MSFYIGIDGGGTKTQYALFNEKKEMLSTVKTTGSNHENLEGAIPEAAGIIMGGINELLNENKLALSDITHILMALAGIDHQYQCDEMTEELKKLGVDVTYAKGYDKKKDVINAELTSEAVNAAKNADVALVFVGLTEEFEGEGYDRTDIDMPSCHNALVSEIAKVNENTVVVLAAGSVVNMPWVNEVKAILNSGLGGQATGSATANILTGKVNPSGKLTATVARKYNSTTESTCKEFQPCVFACV